MRRQSSSGAAGGCAAPSSGIRRRKRYCVLLLGMGGDEGALALAAHQQVLLANSSMALRTVPWLTLKRAAISSSLGMASPGFHSPACRLAAAGP
jgi:hypothetical protein